METIEHGKQNIHLMPGYTAVNNVNVKVLENGDTEISIDNGPTITIIGHMGHKPTIIVNSSEYAGWLVIVEPESDWIRVGKGDL